MSCRRSSRFWGLGCPKIFHEIEDSLVLFLLFTTAVSAVEVSKSPNDDRQYEYLELPNRMRVLLVSDPGAGKPALEALPGESGPPDA